MNLGRKDYRSPSPKEGDPDTSTGGDSGNMVKLHQSTALPFLRPSAVLYTVVVPATAVHAEMRNSGSPSLPV